MKGDCMVTETFGSSWSASVIKNYKNIYMMSPPSHTGLFANQRQCFPSWSWICRGSNAFYMPFCFFTLWLVAKQLWAASCTICNVLNWPAKIWNLYALWFACCWLINCCLIVFYHDPIPCIYNSRIEPIQCACATERLGDRNFKVQSATAVY